MNTIKRYLLSVLFLCVSLSAFSQASVYPIDLSAVMLPPYTNCLGDYFSNGRVQLKAIVKDMSRYGKDATLEYSISVKVKRGNTVVLSSIAPLKRKFSETQIINDIPVKELFSDRNNYTGTASGSFFGNGYCLEEGSYEFEYQLFDKNKGNMPLSEPFSVYCYLTQAEPPVGVFPEDGKCYDPSEIPQTMLFQWIDPIAIGPQTRSYELHIKEDGTDMAFTGNMFPKQEAPSSMELYNQSVFNNNFVLINNSASKFREGHKYYWYVQMRGGAADGTNNNAYKNGGKSQTYSFSIGNCNQEEPKTEFDDTKAKNSIKSKVRIELDSAKVVGGAVKTMWELKSNKNDELICGFKVYCYKVDGGNSDEASEVLSKTLICGKYKAGDTWTEKLNSSVFEEGVEYFCFVRPVLQNGELGLMSNELSFKIESAKATASPSDDDDCIVELTPRSCVGDSLLTSVPKFFFANDAHQVISVDVNETKMEGQTFTGSGIVTPAWLKNIVPDILPLAGLNVEFEKIKINTDGYLCEGEIKVVSDPDNNLYFDLNELVDFNAGATVASKQKEVFTKEVEKEEDIKGDEYKGEVVRVKSTGDLFAVSMADGELQKAKVGTCLDKNDYCPVQYRGALNSKGISLRFDVDTTFNKDTYSPYIDKNANPFTAQNILDGYVSSGSDYIQPWISMVQGEYKWIKAYFEGTPDVDPNNVEFYLLSKNSLALLEKEYVSDDNYFKVKIYGGQPSKSLQIVARSNAKKTDCSKKDDSSDADSNASDDNSTNASSNADASDGGDSDKEDDSKGSGDKKCEECGDDCVTYGSAQIYMLSSKKVKVMLVPVVQSATDNNLNIDDLKAKVTAANEIINKRFAPLGREFELVVDDAYEYADIPDEGFNVSEDNSEWTKETDEMKALRKAYGLKVGKRDEYQACLFLLTQAKKDGLQGYMPRSNSVGFIFLGNNFENVQSDIMAHELCHGLYGLQHTFAYPGAEQGALHENLMDYVDHNDERYLSKYFQWNNMERFNGHVFKLLDDVEDGEAGLSCVLWGAGKWVLGNVIQEYLESLFLDEKAKPLSELSLLKNPITSENIRGLVFAVADECAEEYDPKRLVGLIALANSLYNMYDKCSKKTSCSEICDCYATEGIALFLDEVFKHIKFRTSKRAWELKKQKEGEKAEYDEKSLTEKFVSGCLKVWGVEEKTFKEKLLMSTIPVTIEGGINAIFKYASKCGADLICPWICSSSEPNPPTTNPTTNPTTGPQVMDKDIEVEVYSEVVTVSVRKSAKLRNIVVAGGYDKDLKWPDDALWLTNDKMAVRKCSEERNYAGSGSNAEPFKMEQIDCLSYTMYRFRLPECDKNPVIVTGYATKNGTEEVVEDYDYDKRDCGITIEDAIKQLKGTTSGKTDDTPVLNSITLSKEQKLRLFTRYCSWYIDKVSQTTDCDLVRKKEASCFLKTYASSIMLGVDKSLGSNGDNLVKELKNLYSGTDFSASSTISYTDEYDLVKQVYEEISNDLQKKGVDELPNSSKLRNLDKVEQEDYNAFNAFYMKVLNQSSALSVQSPRDASTMFRYWALSLEDKDYCNKNVSCSDKSQNNNNGNGAGNNEGSTAGK